LTPTAYESQPGAGSCAAAEGSEAAAASSSAPEASTERDMDAELSLFFSKGLPVERKIGNKPSDVAV
jgi:hypothetical protein